jgi:predicted transcriptional regulator
VYKETKVKEVMKRDLIQVNASTPVPKLIQILHKNRIHGVIVVDNAGDVVGVISALDIFKVFKEKGGLQGLIAEDIMTPYAIQITPEDTVHDAALIMLENNIHRLIVTASPTQKKPVGIVTPTDIISLMGNDLPD